MNEQVLIAGGGIGGLACALALARAGVTVHVLEQASAFAELGAGLQLGPNAVRVLNSWGLIEGFKAVAAFPDVLQVRDAHGGESLGQLRLGETALLRYKQPYATLHRADLHALLLRAVRHQPNVHLSLNAKVVAYESVEGGVRVVTDKDRRLQGQALIACDGRWSRVRSQMLGAVALENHAVQTDGHLAYRGMVHHMSLPPELRANVITAWLGPDLHVVHYPVRGGEWFNVVAVVHGVIGQGHGASAAPGDSDIRSWSHEAHAQDLRRALGPAHPSLMEMIQAVPDWKLWALTESPPLAGAHEHAQGRVALLGDAAHPLRPYLAQGAAMALEDAWTLGRLRDAAPTADWPELIATYAQARWQRNAKVQARSHRNGTIFHAKGLMRLGRNAAMALLGEKLLDNPWLYDGPPDPLAD